jgi:preprotein translocase subunit SecE
MAKDQGKTTGRSGKGASAAGSAKPPVVTAPAAPAPEPKKRVGVAQFAKEVRAEARKITWTSWKETWINAVLVGILVTITAVFFLIVDGTLSFLMQQLLRMASS